MPTPQPKACSASVVSLQGIQRHNRDNSVQTKEDYLSVEEPLEIRVNGQSISVTMRTPGHDEELAAGFLFTEGMVRNRADITEIGPCKEVAARPDGNGNIINATMASGVGIDLAKLTRHVFASSSCGLCGKASIANIHLQFPPLTLNPEGGKISLEVLRSLPDAILSAQETFAQTGGVHAAGIFDFEGRLLVAREDVGRHNAVDKVVGHGLLQNHPPYSRHILFVSGRASFEIVQKALAARIPVVAAVSAPSSLAVEFARSNVQTLIGFLRNRSLNIYSHPGRIAQT